MDQKEKDHQRERNMNFLKGMLDTFVDIVVDKCAAVPDTGVQTDLVLGIRKNLLGMMKKQLFAGQKCTKENCPPPNRCEGQMCLDEGQAGAFTWPE